MHATDLPSSSWLRDTLQQGFDALNAGRVQQASEFARRAVAARQDLPEAHFLVGLIALTTHQHRTAVEAFGSVTRLVPEHAAAWAQLARLFAIAGHLVAADEALAEAVRYDSGDPAVADLMGIVCSLLGDQEAAARQFARATEAAPDNVAYLVNRANSATYLGELDHAELCLGKALELAPDSAQAHWILSGLRTAADDSHVRELERLLTRPRLAPTSRAFLCYALGKELEDLGRWPAAFRAYAAGAEARRSVIHYDEPAETAMFDLLERRYDRAWLDARTGGAATNAPVFVLGQPRTGTTLVERILSAHPDVHSAGELRQFGNAVRRLSGYRGPGRFSAELMRDALSLEPRALGEAYATSAAPLAGTRSRFVDKLPQNYLYLPLILAALPNAKIVHVRRHPMDACLASFRQLFADAYPHSYDLREMGRHHARYRALMAHYRREFGDRFFEIDYETVAADPGSAARALIGYLGLAWSDACLDFHRQEAAVTTASAVQVREPAHTRSIGRWLRYREELTPLVNELRACGVEFAVPNT